MMCQWRVLSAGLILVRRWVSSRASLSFLLRWAASSLSSVRRIARLIRVVILARFFVGMVRCVHFVWFRGDEYLSAVRAFGPPDFIHYGWDRRAQRDIAEGDLIVFAKGAHDQAVRDRNFDDINEALL